MKKIITLLTLSILLIGSYKIYAEEYETLWVKPENDSFVFFSEDPKNKSAQANYCLVEDKAPSKKSYTVYRTTTATRWYIAAYVNGGKKEDIAKKFFSDKFALEQNKNSYSIFYSTDRNNWNEDTTNTAHQIGSSGDRQSYRESYIALKETGNDSTICNFIYNKNGEKNSIVVSFKHFPTPDSIKLICNLLDSKNDKIKDKQGKDIDIDVFLKPGSKKQDTCKKVINYNPDNKTLEIVPSFEDIDIVFNHIQPKPKVFINNNEKELQGSHPKYNCAYQITNGTTNTISISMMLPTTDGPKEYFATVILQSQSKTEVWVYVICALAVLFISALVYFALKIWGKREKTDSNNNGQTGNNIPVVKNNTEVPKENKEEGGEEEKKDNPGERIIDCVSTLDIAYKDLIKALNKITDETNTLQKEASKHSEQTKIINELEALLQNNTGKIGIPFQNNNSLIEKFKLVLEQLKKINGTINKEIAERKLDITDTTGNGKLIKLFETLENELEEKKATIILLNEQIVGLNKKISDLLKTTSSLNQRIADSITSQLKDICSIATEIRKKLPDKEQNKILSGIFEYIPDNINQMINDITEIGTSDYDQLCKNLSEIIINNLRHNGWIDKMLRLYSFSSDSQINTDFNERGLNTSLLGDMSMKIISMLSQLGITLNIPKIFTKYNEQTTDISNQEEYLTRICSKNDEILSRIRNLDKNTICDVLHIGYTISQKEPVKSQVNIQVL